MYRNGFPPNYRLRPNWNLRESPSSCPSISCIAHTVLRLFSPTLASCSQQHDLRVSLEGRLTRLLFRHVTFLCFQPGRVHFWIPRSHPFSLPPLLWIPPSFSLCFRAQSQSENCCVVVMLCNKRNCANPSAFTAL